MNAKPNFLVFMAIIALTTATQGHLSGQAVSDFNAVKTSLQGQLTEGEQAEWKLKEAQLKLVEAEAALKRDQESVSELILSITQRMQDQQVQDQQSEDLLRRLNAHSKELQAKLEQEQAKLEQEQAAHSELIRVNAVMKEMTERLNIITASDPLKTMKICQEMLPKLDDPFRVYMEYSANYGDAYQRINVQRWYDAIRQQLLDIFNLAQRQSAQPNASPTSSPGSVSKADSVAAHSYRIADRLRPNPRGTLNKVWLTTNPEEKVDTNGISGPATVNPAVEEKTSPTVESPRAQGAVTATLVPMTKEDIDKLEQEKIAEEQAKRKLFEKQEAEREANGDFSRAPGLTPEQREAAEIRWSEKYAAESIKGAKPAPQ